MPNEIDQSEQEQSIYFAERINFIKQVTPFTYLPFAQLSLLAQHMTELTLPSNAVIFHEGDIGEECYVIYAGKVEIFISEHVLAILEPPTLFGEVAILTHAPRNANARMPNGGRLLVIQKQLLLELIKNHSSMAESMALLSLERSHPVRHAHIMHYQRSLNHNQFAVILKDSVQGRYFQLSEIGWLVWQSIDGKRTIQDIIVLVAEKYEIFAPDVVTDTIFNLANAGFISLPAIDIFNTQGEEPALGEPATKQNLLKRWSKLLRMHFVIHNLDKKLTASYHAGIYLLFKPISQILLIVFALSGTLAFGAFTPEAMILLPSIQHPFLLLIMLMLVNFFLIFFHELGHAYTTKYFGREVYRGGIIFYWYGVIAYVDTSDMWLSGIKPRILVHLAGPFTDLVLAAVTSISAWLVTTPDTRAFFWLLSFLLYYSVLKNLNPLHQGDGYYVLVDLLNSPKLRFQAFQWVRGLNLRRIIQADERKKHTPEKVYWLISLFFLAIALIFSLILQAALRSILPQAIAGIASYHLFWLLPGLVLINFILIVFNASRKMY